MCDVNIYTCRPYTLIVALRWRPGSVICENISTVPADQRAHRQSLAVQRLFLLQNVRTSRYVKLAKNGSVCMLRRKPLLGAPHLDILTTDYCDSLQRYSRSGHIALAHHQTGAARRLRPLTEPAQLLFPAGRSCASVPKQQSCSAHCSQGGLSRKPQALKANSRRLLVHTY